MHRLCCKGYYIIQHCPLLQEWGMHYCDLSKEGTYCPSYDPSKDQCSAPSPAFGGLVFFWLVGFVWLIDWVNDWLFFCRQNLEHEVYCQFQIWACQESRALPLVGSARSACVWAVLVCDHKPFTSTGSRSSKLSRALLLIPLWDPKLTCADITKTHIGCFCLVKLHSLKTGLLAASLCCPRLPAVV